MSKDGMEGFSPSAVVVGIIIGVCIAILTLCTSGCGTKTEHENRRYDDTVSQQIEKIKNDILNLQGIQSQIDDLVKSDFATCPSSGDTANSIINVICKVSQFANHEFRTEVKGMLGTFASTLEIKINNVNDSLAEAIQTEIDDVTAINASIATINTTLSSLNSSISSLTTRMTSAETAISTLQSQIAAISGTVAGGLSSLDIGIENLSAGPLYETILRFNDKSKINAYVEAYIPTVTLGSNPMTATSGNSVIRVTKATHSLLAGDNVFLNGLVGSRGFTNANVTGFFTVTSVINVDTFTITSTRNATSNGAFGGSSGTLSKLTGRGLATIWKTTDGADSVVRTTSYGSPRYNFIVKASGDICYDKTNASATFATINASGLNIVCK